LNRLLRRVREELARRDRRMSYDYDDEGKLNEGDKVSGASEMYERDNERRMAREAARETKVHDRYVGTQLSLDDKPPAILGHSLLERLLIERDEEVGRGWAKIGSVSPIGQMYDGYWDARGFVESADPRPPDAEVQLMRGSAATLALPI
jgi:hypothetical protein